MSVVIETSLGDITLDLYTKHRPKTCYNFLKLCKIKYYNYCLIFEIKKDYTLRTGDPRNNGEGGNSIYSFDETLSPRKKYFNAEQIPIIKHSKKDNLEYLDRQGHTVFGETVEGFDIINLINKQLLDKEEHPYRDICINHTVIIDDPFDDPSFVRRILRRHSSPDIPQYLIDSSRVGICDDLDENDGKTEEEIKAELEEKEAKSRAIVLEMIGDLPSADAKPPDNVLFVCKLNPITEEEDLRRIFSRFGKINSVQIIKDPKTDQSLQYGFIEFDEKNHCEKAYLKMDNVLIDDRRIHVDFSQSVAKMKKYKRY